MQRFITIVLLSLLLTQSLSAHLENNHFYTLKDPLSPYTKHTSVNNDFSLFLQQDKDESPQRLDPRYEKIVKELAYMQVFAIGTIGVIALLPEGVSQWSAEDKAFVDAQELLAKHADNVAAGPVWDNDAWAVNYIGHPVAGSYFYVWGRQSGLTWQESAILTTLMSTFFWEYGWEAFAETPSTQDLIVTPLLGSLLGEGTNYLYNCIMENNGQIYDSTFLGSIGRGLLNPIGEVNKYLDAAFSYANIEISVDYAYNQNVDNYRLRNTIENNGQIQSYFKLNFKLKY